MFDKFLEEWFPFVLAIMLVKQFLACLKHNQLKINITENFLAEMHHFWLCRYNENMCQADNYRNTMFFRLRQMRILLKLCVWDFWQKIFTFGLLSTLGVRFSGFPRLLDSDIRDNYIATFRFLTLLIDISVPITLFVSKIRWNIHYFPLSAMTIGKFPFSAK